MTVRRRPLKTADDRTAEQRMRAAGVQQTPARRTRRDDAVRGGASGRETAGSGHGTRRPRKATVKRRRWPWIVLAVFLVLVVAVVGSFSWDRWLRYDDADDFVGEWTVVGESTTVVIDGRTIRLTDDVSYPYTLDTGAKTIEFTFGNRSGEGHYRFSPDRSQLVILENGDCSWSSTLFDDVAWTFDDLVRTVQGRSPVEYSGNDTTTVLSRLSHDTTASPDTDSERQPGDVDPSGPPAAEEPRDGAAPVDGSEHPDGDGSADDGSAADGRAGDGLADDADPDAGTAPGNLFDVDDV